MTQIHQDFVEQATNATLEKVAERMRERNIDVLVVNNGEEARQVALDLLPQGAEVHSGKSKTLQNIGIFDAIMDPNQYNALRHQSLKMDRKTQMREI